jgi:site-specific DNA-methyltransferase (adenine-specific)
VRARLVEHRRHVRRCRRGAGKADCPRRHRTSDLAGYDEAALLELLEELPDLTGTGFDEAALEELVEALGEPALGEPEGELPPIPAEPRTRPGACYALGRHLLLCGDAREEGCYRRLLGEERAELLWTDPPYGVDYAGRTSERLKLTNDHQAGLGRLLSEAFAALDPALAAGVCASTSPTPPAPCR